MTLTADLRQRHRSLERMDVPHLPTHEHVAALSGLRRINAFTRTARLVWAPVRRFLQDAALPKSGTPPTFHMLDIASGAGDLAVNIAYWAARNDWDLTVEGWDISPCAVRFAQAANAKYRLPLNFQVRDALLDPLPTGLDILTCSLFLHHLDESAAVRFLAALKTAAPRLVVIQDLCRSRWGYRLATWGPRLLTRSPIVHEDARLSVEGAFTPAELRGLCDRAGLTGMQITLHWPARWVLTWRPPET